MSISITNEPPKRNSLQKREGIQIMVKGYGEKERRCRQSKYLVTIGLAGAPRIVESESCREPSFCVRQ